MGRRTALYESHVAAGAHLQDFGGWEMPIHYGSQIQEHLNVRAGAGMMDVSHMAIVDVAGVMARELLRRLLANDVARLDALDGKAMYSALLNERGGIIDDLIVYRRGDGYRIVFNCAREIEDLAWVEARAAGTDVRFVRRRDLAMLAVQGPDAIAQFKRAWPQYSGVLDALQVFQGVDVDNWFIARTGYTGEDGLELVLPGEQAAQCWQTLHELGVSPAGLGARDTLRLEAGMNLYGQEMDETINPFEANMAWTLDWNDAERDFIGRSALQALRERVPNRLVGLLLEQRRGLRAGQRVRCYDDNREIAVGIITSGTFSPSLRCGIALARVPKAAAERYTIENRGQELPVLCGKPVFVRRGEGIFTGWGESRK